MEEVTATVNGTVRFECEATGHPEPTVSWLWNDLPIEADPRHQLLEGGTVLQVGVPLSRWLCWGETLDRGDGVFFPPKGGCPGLNKVLMGVPASPPAQGSPQCSALLCRWHWWRRVTVGVTRAWLRTRPGQPRSTLPLLCRVRHLPFPGSLIYSPPPLSPPTGVSCGSGAASVSLCWSRWPRERSLRCHTLRAGERLSACFLLGRYRPPH